MKTIKTTATLPSRLADTGRVHFGAGVGMLPRRG